LSRQGMAFNITNQNILPYRCNYLLPFLIG
jgi:hypothetical protein